MGVLNSWGKSLFELCEVEGGRKGRQTHAKEAQRVLESERSTLKGKHLSTHGQLIFHGALLLVELFNDKHAIKPLEIVKGDTDGAVTIIVWHSGEVIQTAQKLQTAIGSL